MDAFRAGLDVHQITGEQIAGGRLFYTEEHRRAAKAIDYGLMYGMSAFRLSKELGIAVKEAFFIWTATLSSIRRSNNTCLAQSIAQLRKAIRRRYL